jgi:hypothetical protein
MGPHPPLFLSTREILFFAPIMDSRWPTVRTTHTHSTIFFTHSNKRHPIHFQPRKLPRISLPENGISLARGVTNMDSILMHAGSSLCVLPWTSLTTHPSTSTKIVSPPSSKRLTKRWNSTKLRSPQLSCLTFLILFFAVKYTTEVWFSSRYLSPFFSSWWWIWIFLWYYSYLRYTPAGPYTTFSSLRLTVYFVLHS